MVVQVKELYLYQPFAMAAPVRARHRECTIGPEVMIQ